MKLILISVLLFVLGANGLVHSYYSDGSQVGYFAANSWILICVSVALGSYGVNRFNREENQ